MLLGYFHALGQQHAGHGVRESFYDEVGTALLRALHEGLGDHYSDEVEEAWAPVYGAIAETMIASGRSSDSQTSPA